MPDSDGYPTYEELLKIENFHVDTDEHFDALMEFVASLWYYPDLIKRSRRGRWTLITGGWSGNESIIGSLDKNIDAKLFYWESSIRGGRHTYAPHNIVFK